jgi:hypothetical protein
MASSIQVRIVLTGKSLDPHLITQELGLEPTKTWRLGDRIGKSQLSFEHDGWCFSLPKSETLDLGKEIRRLLDLLGPCRAAIRNLQTEHGPDVEIACEVWIGEHTPSVHLEADLLADLSAMGACLDVDLFISPDRGNGARSNEDA